MTWPLIAAVVALAFLGWNLYRRFGSDRIAECIERRRATSEFILPNDVVARWHMMLPPRQVVVAAVSALAGARDLAPQAASAT